MASLDVRGRADGAGALGAFDLGAAHRLHDGLFTPAVRAVTDGKSRLVIVADDALTSLPFAVLVQTAPEPDTGYASADWMVRTRTLVSLPAMSMLSAEQSGDGPPGDGAPQVALSGYLGVGAPLLGGGQGLSEETATADLTLRGAEAFFRGGSGDVVAINALPALPAAEGELLALAGLVQTGRAQILGGAAASEPAVKAAMSRPVSVMAFATHGLVTGELSGLAEPALVLTPPEAASLDNDGLLTASEIATLRIDVDWVILSACNTAAGDGAGAPGLSGLAQAFFYAGGRSLLASHWPVRDDAAARLTSRALSYAARGEDRAGALRLAMLDTMTDDSLPDAAHPAVWAPFVYVGR
jgi:CHAT domain-containing protein